MPVVAAPVREDTAGRASHRLEPTIEGLRAFAVVAVLLHHAFPWLLPGGFCGVDIFFVISGYLIGGQLLARSRDGVFSFGEFYAARARRLFPALIVVLAATWTCGAWIMTGPEFAALGRHILASAGFANNFVLAGESGYFDAPAATKPLLHLWSLGIEEQFYLVAPLLVWLGARSGPSAATWALRLGAASLLWTLWRWDLGQARSFYDPAFRFWELAAGVALAAWRLQGAGTTSARLHHERRAWALVFLCLAVLQLGIRDFTLDLQTALPSAGLALIALIALALLPVTLRRPEWLAEYGAIIGLLLLVGGVVFMPSDSWPGPHTIIPVAGTLLVLSSKERGALSVLRSRFAVAVGGISYPLYLWHWPALVFLRLTHSDPDAGEVAFVLLCAVALAWATKTCVEEPLRFGRIFAWKVPRVPVAGVAAALLAVAGAGWASYASGGLPQRFPPALRAIGDWSDPDPYGKWRPGECFFYLNDSREFAPHCSPPLTADAPTVLLWGDSQAAHLWLGVADEARQSGFQVAQWTMGSCPPTVRPIGHELPSCARRREQNWKKLRTYAPDVVILAAAWGLYLRAGTTQAELAGHIQSTIAALRSNGVRQVIVFGQGQIWDAALPAVLYQHMARHFVAEVPERFGHAAEDLWSLDRSLQRASESSGVKYFSVLQALCTRNGCRTVADPGQARPDLLYWDKIHLTPSGAHVVIAHAKPVLLDAIRAACPQHIAGTRSCPASPSPLPSGTY